MKKLPWKLYCILLTILVFNSLKDLFSKESAVLMYYTILTVFNKYYLLFLSLNIINIFMGILTCWVVFLYAFDIERPLKFWKILFWIRIFFDLAGHHYDSQFMKAGFSQNFSYGLACIGIITLPIIPSYLAHYQYAFKKTSS